MNLIVRTAFLLAALAAATAASAQLQSKFTQSLVQPPVVVEAPAAVPETSAWALPQGVAQLFQQGCIQHEAQAEAVVDWALSQGFEPADPMRGSVDSMLSGQAGSVLVAPGTGGRVMLAAADKQHCTVWAERMNGPSLRAAMAEMLAQQATRGMKVQVQADRNVERAGAWRNQMQWRYKGVGATQQFGLGAVTTLPAAPGTQALHMEPMAATPGFAPDGVPAR